MRLPSYAIISGKISECSFGILVNQIFALKLEDKVIPPGVFTLVTESGGELPILGIPTGRLPVDESGYMSFVYQNIMMLEVAMCVNDIVLVLKKLVDSFLESGKVVVVIIHVEPAGI